MNWFIIGQEGSSNGYVSQDYIHLKEVTTKHDNTQDLRWFASQDIQKGDTLMFIPDNIIIHPSTEKETDEHDEDEDDDDDFVCNLVQRMVQE